MKEIMLTQGKIALIDDADLDWLSKFTWHAYKDKNTFYARRYISKIGDKQTLITMHRQILGLTDPNIIADHKDRNGLNNQRSNLRIATPYQNNANKQSSGASKFLGVFLNTSTYKNKTYRYWQSCIQKNGKKAHLGCFKTEEEAALAYNKAAIEIHGEFANLNII